MRRIFWVLVFRAVLVALGFAGWGTGAWAQPPIASNDPDVLACEPFGLANSALATIIACDMKFTPVLTPSPKALFKESPATYTFCDNHVDARRYWRNENPIYAIDHYTGIQWVLPGGVVSDGASFPPPLRRLWTDHWSGLQAENLLVEGDGRVPFAFVAGFMHDYYMCKIILAEREARPLRGYETPGCVHQMFEHLLMAFYNTPVLARVSGSSVSMAGWMRGAGQDQGCPYTMASSGRPQVFDFSSPIRSPFYIVTLSHQGASWSGRKARQGMAISILASRTTWDATKRGFGALGNWSRHRWQAVSRLFSTDPASGSPDLPAIPKMRR